LLYLFHSSIYNVALIFFRIKENEEMLKYIMINIFDRINIDALLRLAFLTSFPPVRILSQAGS